MREVRINVAQVVGGGICVSATDGHKVHDRIRAQILDGCRVCLSFESVTRMTTAFLNAAVGQLYGEFGQPQLRQHLAPPLCADARQLVQLKLVVDRAKAFFENEDATQSAYAQVLEIEDG